jgi:hypothetical protein
MYVTAEGGFKKVKASVVVFINANSRFCFASDLRMNDAGVAAFINATAGCLAFIS